MAKQVRLEEGAYSHPPCPGCTDEPATKLHVATDTRWVTRLQFCDAEGGALVDFSIGLQIATPTGWRPVARWSVGHANFHIYQWSWRGPGRVRFSYGPLNDVDDVARAYQQAVQDAYPRVDTLVNAWRKGLQR